ncbi:protein of unknown function [Streptomyces murinus]
MGKGRRRHGRPPGSIRHSAERSRLGRRRAVVRGEHPGGVGPALGRRGGRHGAADRLRTGHQRRTAHLRAVPDLHGRHRAGARRTAAHRGHGQSSAFPEETARGRAAGQRPRHGHHPLAHRRVRRQAPRPPHPGGRQDGLHRTALDRPGRTGGDGGPAGAVAGEPDAEPRNVHPAGARDPSRAARGLEAAPGEGKRHKERPGGWSRSPVRGRVS